MEEGGGRGKGNVTPVVSAAPSPPSSKERHDAELGPAEQTSSIWRATSHIFAPRLLRGLSGELQSSYKVREITRKCFVLISYAGRLFLIHERVRDQLLAIRPVVSR